MLAAGYSLMRMSPRPPDDPLLYLIEDHAVADDGDEVAAGAILQLPYRPYDLPYGPQVRFPSVLHDLVDGAGG